MATRDELLAKLNARYGTEIADYFMMLVWLKRAANRCERKGYSEQAAEYRMDYNELSLAAIGEQS